MDNLETIWNQETYGSKQIETTSSKVQSIIDKLEKEEQLTQKYKPLPVIVILVFGAIFSYVIFKENNSLSVSQIIGISFVVFSGIAIGVFSVIIKMPLDEKSKGKSVAVFLNLIKQKLDKKRLMFLIGSVLQVILLSIGLYILIFNNSNDMHVGYKYTFFGIMFGIAGLSIGGGIATFNTHYKSTYQVINQFIRED